MKNFSIIPDASDIKGAMEISTEYGVAFEYNDFTSPDIYNDSEEVNRLIRMYKGLGRDMSRDTMHGAFLGTDIAAIDPFFRNRSQKLLSQSVQIADELGCRGVVFHTGLIGTLRLEYYLDNWLCIAEAFFSKLCEKYPHIEIYLENTFEQEPEIFGRLMERMKTNHNFRLCLDYGHAFLTQTPVSKWCKSFAPYIGHMHLNDNDGCDDLHLVPGQGKIDFLKLKEQLREFDINVQMLLELKGYENARAALEYMKGL